MIDSTLTLSPARLAWLRRRTLASLMVGVALGSTGHIAATTVATVVAKDLAGATWLAGAPGATVVLGAAVGATLLARLMVARGRRAGIASGYLVGVLGALLATAAVVGDSLVLLLLGTILIGFGNSSNQASRYVAADLVPVNRRASWIGYVVWSATVGAVLGPSLIESAGRAGEMLGLPLLAGAYLLPILFVGSAAVLSFVLLRPDPYALAERSADDPGTDQTTSVLLVELVRRPRVGVAIAALVAGQFVMVLIMTMTPLHMTDHGHDLAAVGIVISGHTFGMFALSPISGRLTDRFGSPRIVLLGLTVTAAAAILSALAPPEGGPQLFMALFLLGYGWNLGFVAGSTLLTRGLSLPERTRLQGVTDALIWSTAAVASLGSGIIVALASFASLGILGVGVVIVPALLVASRRRSLDA